MSGTHRIRLAGPWQFTVTTSGPDAISDAVEQQRCQLPFPADDVQRKAFSDGVILTRRFHRPTGLTAGHRVSMMFRGIHPTACHLNRESVDIDAICDESLPGSPTARVDLTGCLSDFNIISVQLPAGSSMEPGDLNNQCLESVWLEIDESSVS
ncbi:MAG: hypothetical protein KDA96_05540 [Planctomycetaceae bacterium]|nr:hypothetical protein [Planctomycetaceae bacterium]